MPCLFPSFGGEVRIWQPRPLRTIPCDDCLVSSCLTVFACVAPTLSLLRVSWIEVLQERPLEEPHLLVLSAPCLFLCARAVSGCSAGASMAGPPPTTMPPQGPPQGRALTLDQHRGGAARSRSWATAPSLPPPLCRHLRPRSERGLRSRICRQGGEEGQRLYGKEEG
jgi:hypothetical protein